MKPSKSERETIQTKPRQRRQGGTEYRRIQALVGARLFSRFGL